MRKRVKPPPGYVDTIDAAPICGLLVKRMAVYRQPAYQQFGPPWHRYDGAPVYALAEIRKWAAGRFEKAKAKAERLERVALSTDDPRFDWLDDLAKESAP